MLCAYVSLRTLKKCIARTYNCISRMIKIIREQELLKINYTGTPVRLYSYSVKINYGYLAAIKLVFHKLEFKDLIIYLSVFKFTENDFYLLCIRKICMLYVCIFCLRFMSSTYLTT